MRRRVRMDWREQDAYPLEDQPQCRIGAACCAPGEMRSDDSDHRSDAGAGGDRTGGWKKGYRFAGAALSGETRRRAIFRLRVRLSERRRYRNPEGQHAAGKWIFGEFLL